MENKIKEYLNEEYLEACGDGDLDKVIYYLTSPHLKVHADIGLENGDDFWYAAMGGHMNIIEFFLTSDRIKRIHNSQTLFNSACVLNNVDMLEYSLSSSRLKEHACVNNIYFFTTIEMGYVEIIAHILKNKEYELQVDFAYISERLNEENKFPELYSSYMESLNFMRTYKNFLSDNIVAYKFYFTMDYIAESILSFQRNQQEYIFKKHESELAYWFLKYGIPIPSYGEKYHEEIPLYI